MSGWVCPLAFNFDSCLVYSITSSDRTLARSDDFLKNLGRYRDAKMHGVFHPALCSLAASGSIKFYSRVAKTKMNKHVAFFRNLNLGRPNCPTKVQFEEAFAAAGAVSASSFLTNGTMVFTTRSGSQSQRVFNGACEILRRTCGLKEPGYIRTIDYLTQLIALDPFVEIESNSVHTCCASFLHATNGLSALQLPLESKRRDVKVLQLTHSEAFSVSIKVGNTPGSPNAFLEKLLGLPVTTRSWNTVVRLVQKHA